MAVVLRIPEALALRRTAASLASALAANSPSGGLHLGLSAGHFFRYIPWSGERRKTRSIAEPMESTAGQYFSAFNWEGLPPATRIPAPGHSDRRSSMASNILADIVGLL